MFHTYSLNMYHIMLIYGIMLNIWAFFSLLRHQHGWVEALFFCHGHLSYPNNVSIALGCFFSSAGQVTTTGDGIVGFPAFQD